MKQPQVNGNWNFSSLSFLLLMCVFAACSTDQMTIPQYKTKHVVLIVVDGARWTETWGAQNQRYIPLRRELSNQGVYYTNFSNNGNTATNPGHCAIVTANYQNIDNSGSELPQQPSMFQYYLKATGLAATKAQIIASKDKLEVLSDCKDSLWAGTYNPVYDVGNNGPHTGYRTDDITYSKAIKALAKDNPNLMLIQFREPDYSGHANNWDAYLKGITQTDKYVKSIWAYLQSNPYYAGTTTLIVTNDHGRHTPGYKDGFVSHGDYCNGCKHIEFFAIGPDFKPGKVYKNNREQIDIATTIAHLMGFSMPTASGKVMSELFW
jgi:alkaline phosphatase